MTARREDSVSEAMSGSGDRHVVPSVLLVPSSPVPCTRLLFLCLHADLQIFAFGRGAGKTFHEVCTKSADQVAEDLYFDAIKNEVEENMNNHCFVSPAVSTFTFDLRGNVAPNIYGWTPMTSDRKNVVRYETLLVLRAAEILNIFVDHRDTVCVGAGHVRDAGVCQAVELAFRCILHQIRELPGRSAHDGRDEDP